MIKGFKDMFIYKKANDGQEEFRLPESPEESKRWDQYQGKNGENENQEKNEGNKEVVNKQGKQDESDQSNSDSTKGSSAEDKKRAGKNSPRIIEPITVEQMIKSKEQEQNNKDKNKDKDKKNKEEKSKANQDKTISKSLDENIKYLQDAFHLPVNQDIIIREFKIAHKIPACIVFIDGMIDNRIAIQFTLPQLMDVHAFDKYEGGCPISYIKDNVLSINQIVEMKKYQEIIPQILNGLMALFIDGCDECIVMESRGYEKRSVSTPMTETVVEGSQEAFTENLRTNITLVRRIVKNEDLITEFMIVSKTNNYLAAVLYMDGVANPKIIEEVKRRVESLDIDYISGSGMLEQLIEKNRLTLFPKIISTERPDRIAAFLMEGKVVLVCEGTPFALAVPITFFDLFHSSEDANLRWQFGSFLRIIRLLGTLMALLLPGLWTALILYHQEMIPTTLLNSIIISRIPVPFPFIFELLIMELSFELIREGGIRVPGVTGNTLGIIGALILGQSAVEAGLVSPSLIIIVAVSGLGNFAIPNYSLALAVRIYRFVLIAFGAMAGFYGISVGFTILCALTLSAKSFGVPFFSPISPTTKSNKDKIIRDNIYNQTYRPDYLNTENEKRMGDSPRGWIRTGQAGGRDNE